MKNLVWVSMVLFSFATGSITVAEDSLNMCSEGQLFWGVDGGGNTTAVAVFSEMPPMGEQLGDFDLVLMANETVDCHRNFRRHGGTSRVLKWEGVVRGRQTETEGMHHALVNTDGDGYAFTEDTVELPALFGCETGGAPGFLLREKLNFTEGVWDDLRIKGGAIVVDVCLPLEMTVGASIWFEVIDGSYLCLSPEGESL